VAGSGTGMMARTSIGLKVDCAETDVIVPNKASPRMNLRICLFMGMTDLIRSGISTIHAASRPGLDRLRAGQLIMFTVTIPLRAAILRLDRDKRLHSIETYFILWTFSKPGFSCRGRIDAGQGKFPGKLVRGLLQMANMIMESQNAVSAPRAAEGVGFATQNI
jgi:hypothetical protein